MNDSLIVLLILFICICFVGYFNHVLLPRIKGKQGESRIANKLRRLKIGKFLVLNDLLLQNSDRTSQIDHVVISRSGIFVIETKNYTGWIFGHEESENWKQVIYKNSYTFRNPIKQNWSHVYSLKDALSEFGFLQFFPIVVFCGTGELKGVTSSLPVIYPKRLLKTIRGLDKNPVISIQEMKDIYNHLKSKNVNDRKVRRQHVKQIKTQSQIAKNKLKQMKCPRCSGKMVKRNGIRGPFYGCSNFPNCKYSKNFIT